jgi:hypothetical protein
MLHCGSPLLFGDDRFSLPGSSHFCVVRPEPPGFEFL